MLDTHFSTSNKRFDKSNAFRPAKDSTDHISAEALVTNTDVHQGKNIREATQPYIYCKGNHFNDSCKQYTGVSTRKKQLQDVLFALEPVMFPKNVQLVLSPVIIVKGLDIIIQVFVQQSLKFQMKVILRKLLLTLVQLTLINHHNLMRKILNLQQW